MAAKPKQHDVTSSGGVHGGTETVLQPPAAVQPLPAKPFTLAELEGITEHTRCLFHVQTDAQAPVEGMMPRGIVGVLAGPPGSGKSFLALEFMLAAAQGGSLFGAPTVGVPYVATSDAGRVLYLSLEDDRENVGRRLRRIMQRRNSAPEAMERALARIHVVAWDDVEADCDRVLFRPNASRTGLEPTKLFERASATLRDGEPWALIVVDTLARAARGGIEVDAEAATDAIQQLELWTKLPGAPVVLVVHHNRKEASGADKPAKRLAALMNVDHVRGSGALSGAVRWIGMLGKLTASADEIQKHPGCPRRNVFFEVVKANSISEDAMRRLHLTPDKPRGGGGSSTGVLRLADAFELDGFEAWVNAADHPRKTATNGQSSNGRTVDEEDWR